MTIICLRPRLKKYAASYNQVIAIFEEHIQTPEQVLIFNEAFNNPIFYNKKTGSRLQLGALTLTNEWLIYSGAIENYDICYLGDIECALRLYHHQRGRLEKG